MRHRLSILLFLALASPAFAQTDQPYRLNVFVDEVIFTFHAADAHGLPINDLTLSDLTLLDSGIPPATLAHDGDFHPIVLATPDRVATLTVRSGYYAPNPNARPNKPTKPAPPSPDR